PRTSTLSRLEAIRRYPVSLADGGATAADAEPSARAIAARTGQVFISSSDDPDVISGQGTVALEILEDEPHVDAIVVPVGGGALLAGTALVAHAMNPAIRVYGAEPRATARMNAAMRGTPAQVSPTVAEAIAEHAPPGALTQAIVR